MKHQYLRLSILVILLILLSACEMKASTPPPTAEGMETMQAFATSTSIAKTDMAQKNVPETPLPTPGDTEETDTPSGPENTATATPDTSAAQPVQTYEVPSTYTIQKGEFPFCIARRFDINQYDLLAYNNLGLNTRLDPGATIQIPPNPRPFSGNRSLMKHPTTYTVQAGDTFHSIACKFGDVDPRAIADANNMDINQSLTAGSTISIP